jgi:hypothetical protein
MGIALIKHNIFKSEMLGKFPWAINIHILRKWGTGGQNLSFPEGSTSGKEGVHKVRVNEGEQVGCILCSYMKWKNKIDEIVLKWG